MTIKTDRRQFADSFWRGGPIYTAAVPGQVVAACAVRDGRIIGTGDVPALLHLVGPETTVVDLDGRCLLPGLIDAHSHIVGHGQAMANVDCKHSVGSLEDIIKLVAEASAGRPEGTWILGRGYNQGKLAEGRHPSRQDLDRAAPRHAVALTRTCGHIVACNSLALRLAGITAETHDPDGGAIDRDAAGEPTGVLRESATALVWSLLRPTVQAYSEAYAAASRDYLSHGITSTHDASGGDRNQVRAMIEGQLNGQAIVRTYMMMRAGAAGSAGDAAANSGLVTGLGGQRIKVGPLKVMLDGSSSGPTAATKAPYASEPGNRGILYFDQTRLNDIVIGGAAAGFQMTAHAVGDLAIEMMLDALAATGGGARARHRIEHCAMLNPQLVGRLAGLGVIPVANPCFLWEFGDGYLRDYGQDRGSWMFPMRALFDAGIPAAAGSDAPVTTVNPFVGFYCAMTRRTSTGATVGAGQAVGFDEILAAYTINAARAAFEECEKGTIESGKLADLVVVEGDLGKSAPEAILKAKVLQTVIGGQVVYER